MNYQVKVHKVYDTDKPVKALVSVDINDKLVIHGIRVIETEKGRFLAMPSTISKDKDNNEVRYDVAHPISVEARKELDEAVFTAYENELKKAKEGYDKEKVRRDENTKPNEDGFSPMQIDGVVYTEKKEAGTALLEYTKKMKSPEAVRMGGYRGFALEMSFDHFSKEYILTMKGALAHSTPLGTDIFGNILRLDNVLNAFDEKQIHCKEQLERERGELENAKTEVQKPFPKEEEYRAKVKRLDELNILLNMDKKENEIVDGEHDEEGKESIPERSSEAR